MRTPTRYSCASSRTASCRERPYATPTRACPDELLPRAQSGVRYSVVDKGNAHSMTWALPNPTPCPNTNPIFFGRQVPLPKENAERYLLQRCEEIEMAKSWRECTTDAALPVVRNLRQWIRPRLPRLPAPSAVF